MSEIKRYNVKCDGDCLEEARDGILVDYRAHRDLVYELKQERDKYKAALNEIANDKECETCKCKQVMGKTYQGSNFKMLQAIAREAVQSDSAIKKS